MLPEMSSQRNGFYDFPASLLTQEIKKLCCLYLSFFGKLATFKMLELDFLDYWIQFPFFITYN